MLDELCTTFHLIHIFYYTLQLIAIVLKKFFILIKDSLRQKATLLPDCFISQTVTNLQDRSRNRQPLLASHHH